MEAEKFILRACELAVKGQGHVRPNPPVGAVIVKSGQIVGEGYHRRCGGDHAEVAAIKDALRRLRPADGRLEGCSLYVTLEPCSRPGRVGACTDAIIKAGVVKVVYAVSDPNPVNRGRARRILKRAGIVCESLTGQSRKKSAAFLACERLIAPFSKHVTTGMPFVTVKIAMSLDGKIADDRGNARWISSARSRKVTGRLRERVDAIMVGAETVRKDNPSLLSHLKDNPDLVRVVISSSGKLPKSSQVFTDGKNPTLVFCDPKTALTELGGMGIVHVLCEGGLKLARSLADMGLVDEWISVFSPVVIGSRPINEALRLKFRGSELIDSSSGDLGGYYGCSRG